jgi:hypothetical protein
MSNIRKVSPAPAAPSGQRAALRDAITERDAKRVAVSRVEKTEARGRELLRTLESALTKFGDLDAVILQHRAKRVTDAARAGQVPPDLKLPDDLVDASKARDEAVEQVTAAKYALRNLSTEVAQAHTALQRAENLVREAAQAILVEEATLLAAALKVAWSNTWHLYDTLNALPRTNQQLPADAVRILRLIPGIDHRQFPGGRNPALARAREGWRTWFEALLKDGDAPKPDLADDGASGAPVGRVA